MCAGLTDQECEEAEARPLWTTPAKNDDRYEGGLELAGVDGCPRRTGRRGVQATPEKGAEAGFVDARGHGGQCEQALARPLWTKSATALRSRRRHARKTGTGSTVGVIR